MGIIFSKSFIIFVIYSFIQNWKQNIKNLSYVCEPLLFMKDDNCNTKEHEEANE